MRNFTDETLNYNTITAAYFMMMPEFLRITKYNSSPGRIGAILEKGRIIFQYIFTDMGVPREDYLGDVDIRNLKFFFAMCARDQAFTDKKILLDEIYIVLQEYTKDEDDIPQEREYQRERCGEEKEDDNQIKAGKGNEYTRVAKEEARKKMEQILEEEYHERYLTEIREIRNKQRKRQQERFQGREM